MSKNLHLKKTAPIVLKSETMRVQMDPATGGVISIVSPKDPHRMNWVASPSECPWMPTSLQWGLGMLCELTWHAKILHRWGEPIEMKADARSVRVRYKVAGLNLLVTRRLDGDGMTEEYLFENAGKKPVEIADSIRRGTHGSGVFAPFNDNYPGAETCLKRRCHAHLWMGEDLAWVNALRMGGAAPHLGMVLTGGRLLGYSIEGRDRRVSSNARGIFLLHPEGFTLKPGQKYRLAWKLFWHQGWEDFFRQVQRHGKMERVVADRLALLGKESAELRAIGGAKNKKLRFLSEGKALPTRKEGKDLVARVLAPKEGEFEIQASDGKHTTPIRFHSVANIEALLKKRAHFIIERQQVTAPGKPLDGALVPYDNELDAPLIHATCGDTNNGRERVGMGVFLALLLKKSPDAKLLKGLLRFDAFVRRELQQKDGTINNGAGEPHQRLYNYPWVMQLHLEMRRLTGEKRHIEEYVKVVRAYYAKGGEKFYAIGVPMLDGVEQLREMKSPHADEVLKLHRQHIERILATGTNFPPHELIYEQSIVGPAVVMLLEWHRLTGDKKALEQAKVHLGLLELFCGRQPDHHLSGISIRHWDGFWFGKRKLWGDTMPHYWSSINALAYQLYAMATGDAAYQDKCDEVLRGNLSQFFADGRATCAWTYPDSIASEPGRCPDPLANDQDWALANWLTCERRGR